MRRYPIALLCLVAVPAFARRASVQPILPRSFSGWNCATPAELNLSQPNGFVAGDPAAIAAEYGFASGEQCTYTRAQDSLQVQLYVMKDATAAYGEYSYLRTPDLSKADFAEHSSASDRRALALDGNLVLDVSGDVGKLGPDLKALLGAVSPHAQEGPLPTLWQHMPAENQVPRSDHYILGPAALAQFFPVSSGGDWLGFSKGAEAEAAHYRLGDQDVTLLITDFPTPQLASAKLAELQQKFGASGANGAPPQLFAKRSVTLVAMVAGAHSQAEADTLLSQVETATQITWNEPAFQFKEPSIEMMIVGSIVGTGAICGFALVAGLAFGGFRLFIKRVLPDRVFDRSSHLQVLQMGLCSKPINSEDFYGITGKLVPTDTVDRDVPDRVALRIFR
jgi:hypothetical protein